MLIMQSGFDMALTRSASRVPLVSKARAALASRAVLAVSLFFLAGAGALFGASVSFEAVAPAPGQENFKHFWNITLHNPKSGTTSVSFRVEAHEVKAGVVFSAGTQSIALAPGDRRLTASDVKLAEVVCKKGYEAFTRPDRVLPEGDYRYVITLDPRMPQATFFLRIRVTKPVELVWPPNGAVVSDSQPVFVWKPPELSGPVVSNLYAFGLFDVGQGQSGTTAFRHNPPVFEDLRLPKLACRLPACVQLEPGRTYAWHVGLSDTAGVSPDTAHVGSRVSCFVYKPRASRQDTSTSFTYLPSGRSVTGLTSLAVTSTLADAELCVMEYSLGSDSTNQDWQVIGSFARVRGSFVGMWQSDSAVLRAGKAFPSPCFVRATVLGRKGQYSETAPLSLVINPPPPPTRRGCGCNEDEKK
jgi:hypothetical protein